MKAVKTILITGASGAIGSALARYYASEQVDLILQGRNAQSLREIGRECESRGARVEVVVLDLSAISALRAWALQLCATRLPDVLIANAGLNTHAQQLCAGENWQDVEALLDVNIKASIALINAFIPAMQQRGSGQIVIMSSLAAFYGLPQTPSYCASKAALKAYGESLRGALAGQGIWVNVVMPGYVSSAMCAAMPGPKPFLWPADKAARVIAQRLKRNPARLSFPFPLNVGTWFLAVMPAAWAQRCLCLFGYGV